MAKRRITSETAVLVVDDEPQLRRVLRTVLVAEGYVVLEAGDGRQALAASRSHDPDLVLLDLRLPVLNGFEVCRQIRRASSVPIIVLTVRNSESAKVQALDSGADDYIVKPFAIQELLARIRSVLRRSSEDEEEAVIWSENLRLDFSRRIVTAHGQQVHLTPKEFDVLRELAAQEGRAVSYRKLLQSVWGPEHDDGIEALRVVVNQLRKKIELDPAHPRYLYTDPGVGYRFVLPDGGSAERRSQLFVESP
jgi:two-component system KDP operon response regulator KdpE